MQKFNPYRSIIVAILCLFYSLSISAQVKGKVLDASGSPLPFCLVGLVKASDTTVIIGTATDAAGKFSIEVNNNGSYRVLASYIGFKTFYSPIFSVSKGGQYDLGNMTLVPEAKILNTVEVAAQKPLVEYKADRTVYNIENSIISAGNNVLEVLKKLPGVSVDNNDNISVNGESGVLIMIDGRTSYMSATDAANYLRSLDASQIESIEIITSPSAKYDASGNTVINIIRKRNKNAGFNGELTSGYSQGIYGRGNEGVNLNYSTKKWNLFANYGYNFGEYLNNFGGTTKFSNNNQVQNIFVDSNQRREDYWSNSGRFEADFMPDKKQTIGFDFEGTQTNGIVNKAFPSYMEGANSQLDSSLNLQGHRTYSRVNTSYGLSYDDKIDSTGKDLSANIDYANYNSTFNELTVTNYYDSLGHESHAPTSLDYSLPTTINIYAAKVDYTQPLGKGGTFETGLKGSYVNTNNNAQYWNVVNGNYMVDSMFTNDFLYTEYIYAGYFNYAQHLNKKTYFKFGLRGEQTEDKGVEVSHDTSFSHKYFNLFPNALITYKLDTNNTLKLFYRRRIWRPDYQSLNPFAYFINPYSYQEGNPALQPQISNSVYIEEQFKQLFVVSVGDEYWTNPINWNAIQNNVTDITYLTPVNFKDMNNSYAKIESTIPFAKWFTSINTLLFMQQQWQGTIEGVNFTNAGFTWTYNTVNMFTLSKHWSCEVDFSYNAKQVYGAQTTNSYYSLDAGVKYKFANDRATVTLNCSDIFWSERYSNYEDFQSENFQNYDYYDTRRLHLTLSWKLGKSEHEQQEKDKASEDETNRVGN
jgi:iron complex outermembrane recepter protein